MNLGGTIHINKVGLMVVVLLTCTVLIIHLQLGTSFFDNQESTYRFVSLKKLLKVAIQAAENGGREVVSASQHDLQIQSKGKTKEGLDNRVTIADYKSHCAMVGTIKSAFPYVPLISEEKKDDCEGHWNFVENSEEEIGKNGGDEDVDVKDLTVWIDPLDATHEYTQQLHQYVTTMVCVAYKGKPIIGVIHNPFLKNTSWVWAGRYRSSDLKRIVLPSVESEAKVRIIVSMSHPGEIKETLQKQFKDKELEIINAAGAGKELTIFLSVKCKIAFLFVKVTRLCK